YTIDIAPAGETTWVDHVFETHKYCVQALSADAGSDTSCAFGPGVNFAGHSQLSWEVCTPQNWNQTFNGPGTYHLIVTVQGVSSANVGHHTELVIQRPGIPDAWRFDDGGCQGLSRVHADAVAVTGCPPMVGSNPVVLLSSAFDGSVYGSELIRLDM